MIDDLKIEPPMLNKITHFFEQFIQSNHSQNDPQHSLNLAIAALLIEMTGIDNYISEDEEVKLKEILVRHYHLSTKEVETMLNLAKEELKDATDYYQFTSLINGHFEQQQKIHMIGQLWRIALADGTIDSHEEHYLRKISDLLFVPHSIFIQCKLKALQESSHT